MCLRYNCRSDLRLYTTSDNQYESDLLQGRNDIRKRGSSNQSPLCSTRPVCVSSGRPCPRRVLPYRAIDPQEISCRVSNLFLKLGSLSKVMTVIFYKLKIGTP